MLPEQCRADRAKLSVNRSKLQAIFRLQPPAEGVEVAMPRTDLKIRQGGTNFPLFYHHFFELEIPA